MKKLVILIPVLNEAGNIVRLVRDLRALSEELQNRLDVQVILLDDGSQDDTSILARQSASEAGISLTMLRHEVNRGPGVAFATGFCHLPGLLQDDDLVMRNRWFKWADKTSPGPSRSF